MPGLDQTGPLGESPRMGRQMGRCGQGGGNTPWPRGGGRRRLRQGLGRGLGPGRERGPAAGAAARGATPSPDATGPDVAQLQQRVQQLTETVQQLAGRLDALRPPGGPQA